jgi:hypothetical protein
LDHYEVQLQLLQQRRKEGVATARGALEAGSSAEPNVWTPPPGWRKNNLPVFEAGPNPLEQRDKGKAVMRDAQPAVSGTVWTPPPGWEESLTPDDRNALKYLREQGKIQLPKRLEQAFSSQQPGTTMTGIPLEGMYPIFTSQAAKEDYLLQLNLLEQQNKQRLMVAKQDQDYQMQLMLLEQQNKRRLMRARQELDAMPIPCPQTPRLSPETSPGDREQSVDSVWSTHFTPESTPGFQEGQKSRMSSLGQIQLKFEPESQQNSPEPSQSEALSCNCASSGQILRDHDLQVTLPEQQNHAWGQHQPWRFAHSDAPKLPSNWSLQHYQEQLMAKEQQGRERGQQEQQGFGSTQPPNHALQDYRTQMAFLQQQNKERLETKRENQGTSTGAPHPGSRALQDYQMQMMLLEQHCKKRAVKTKGVESQGSSDAEPAAEQDGKDEEDQGPVCVAGGSRADILHSKPLVIRQRPTADD